jgi:hypothetical protein
MVVNIEYNLESKMMKIKAKLVFTDWIADGRSIYKTEEGIYLSKTDLHSGSTFDVEVELPIEAVESIKDGIALGAKPVFYLDANK